MGQEINRTDFTKGDFERFQHRLEEETLALKRRIESSRCSQQPPVAGFEIEAWLIDDAMAPAPVNERFLEGFDDPFACPELAKFNIELNNKPVRLEGQALSHLHRGLEEIWTRACRSAESIGVHLLTIGILPTLQQSALSLANMSELNRFRALNEQILRLRGEPIHLEIVGHQHLKTEHSDVMLESAATSFQIHIQAPLDRAHHYYNAAILASAPIVAVSANAPYLFGKDLWAETRIPVFEQSIEVGGFRGAAHGPLHRVSFGSGYARRSILECFEENLNHFPILLPIAQDSDREAFEHLRLHNGTIWRWNRPLIGFDDDGTPHIRIEHRVVPSGPSIVDMLANAAFFYGLTEFLSRQAADSEPKIAFAQAKDNFYQAARHGMNAPIVWLNGSKCRMKPLLLEELLPNALCGLLQLGIERGDAEEYLSVIRQRVESGQNGSEWQRRFIAVHGGDFRTMTNTYLNNQKSGRPVHEWKLC
jgi:hypothetical protein